MSEDEKPKEEAPPKKGKAPLVVAGVGALLLAAGVPTYLLVAKKGGHETAELDADAAEHPDLVVPEGRDEEEDLAPGEEALGAIFPLDVFVVNASGGGVIRTQLQLEFSERDVPKKFIARTPLVRDGIIRVLASKTREDLLSEKGREGVKDDVRELVNTVLRKEVVRRVYFTQYVVQ